MIHELLAGNGALDDLLDFLGVAGTDAVSLELKDQESQGMFRPQGESATDYRYVVMPMRL